MSTQTTQDENREQLQALLRDLFQFDAADLNFGVYRILNQRRDRIEQFIENDLLDAVNESLESLADTKRAEIEEKLEEKREDVRDKVEGDNIFNADGSLTDEYSNLPINIINEYQTLWETQKDVNIAEQTETRIFNDLYRFFSRYYEKGDFHTKRRISSKDSKYYVPYNGEETYFHWANNDQYYVKTAEHFTNYRFDTDEWNVEFRLEKADVPQDNIKGDNRYFMLGRGDPVSTESDKRRVTVQFQYRQITEDEADSYVEAYNEVTGNSRNSFAHMTPDMRAEALEGRIINHLEDKEVERILTAEKDDDASSTVLKSHLTRYVSENTMDYFVHKDLQEFLESELEFFLQNEVLDVDELIKVDGESSPPVLRARTVRKIAAHIISFLAQIEDFQKRLFEKKKFVVQTDFMVTLDHVPDELYGTVLENEAQIEQWREVYNTEEWDADLSWQGEFDKTVIEQHEHLMIDTVFFDDGFKRKLLSSIDNIHGTTDGVLFQGENFQILNLIQNTFRKSADCVYIDPPYNTGNDGFPYKDRYQHSSWLSMMVDRVDLSRNLLSEDGAFFASVDDNEQSNLKKILESTFGEHNDVADIIWEKKYTRANDARWFSDNHDYILHFAKNKELFSPQLLPRSEEQKEAYSNPDNDPRGPWKATPLHAKSGNKESFEYEFDNGVIWSPPPGTYPRFSRETFQNMDENDEIWFGKDGDATPSRKSFLKDVKSGVTPTTLWEHEEVGHNHEAVDELKHLFPSNPFENPKPTRLIKRILYLADSQLTIDFFAGSGTTAEAMMRLNLEEESNRKYLLAELGDHFDSVLRPRIQKIALSTDWTDGVPDNRNGQTQLVKYHRIESYEDALNNITLHDPEKPQQKLVEEEMDDYILGYMLDFESQESASLLPKGTFDEPFSHELEIEQNGTSRESTTVDLVETFHYLLGGKVQQYWYETHQERKYVASECEVDTESGIDTVLTVWRRTENIDYDEEKEWFDEEFDTESYDRVYVNGESQIEQAEPLEIKFREKMEESPNVA